MVDITPRAWLDAALSPLLPATWKIIPFQKELSTFTAPVVILKQSAITRLPEAPEGAHVVEFTVTVASPHVDREKAEDQLDDNVNALIHAIDTLGIGWTRADKVAIDNTYIGWDINLSVTSTKE